MSQVRLDKFDSGEVLDRGASKVREVTWYLCKCVFFLSPLPWPSNFKVKLLRAFGATVGAGAVIKPRINIHFPWKLKLGDHVWLGEGVEIYNFEPVTIGSNCCVSQRAFLCAANHDFRDPAMRYRNEPITLEDGVWVGACAFVGPGVTIDVDSVVIAASVVTKSLPPGMICSGNPCTPRSARWK